MKLVVENGKLAADSREVAEMIGKDHAHLCRDIARYIEVIRQNPKLDSDGNNPKLDSSSGNTSILRASDFFIPSTNPKLGALTNPKLDSLDFFMPATYEVYAKKGENPSGGRQSVDYRVKTR